MPRFRLVTIADFAPEVTLHIAVDDLRRDSRYSTDEAGSRRGSLATVPDSKEEVQ